MVDIQFIDSFRRYDAEFIVVRILNDLFKQFFPFLFRELFGIVDLVVNVIDRQNAAGNNQRTA